MTDKKDPKKRSNTDWEAMETPWRVGIVSVLQLSKDFGVSRAAIQKHWANLGIGRDLSWKIQAAADALVAKSEVTRARLQHQVTPDQKITDAETVTTNAEMQAFAILHQRKDVRRFRGVAEGLLAELEATTIDKELYAQLGDLLHAPDERGVDKLNALYRKVTDMAGRVDSAKKLADTFKTLIDLECKVLGIAETGGDKTPSGAFDVFLAELSARGSRLPMVAN